MWQWLGLLYSSVCLSATAITAARALFSRTSSSSQTTRKTVWVNKFVNWFQTQVCDVTEAVTMNYLSNKQRYVHRTSYLTTPASPSNYASLFALLQRRISCQMWVRVFGRISIDFLKNRKALVFRLKQSNVRDFCCLAMFRIADWYFVINVSRQRVGTIFKCQALHYTHFGTTYRFHLQGWSRPKLLDSWRPDQQVVPKCQLLSIHSA